MLAADHDHDRNTFQRSCADRELREIGKSLEKAITLSQEIRTSCQAELVSDLKHCCWYRPAFCIAPLSACSTPRLNIPHGSQKKRSSTESSPNSSKRNSIANTQFRSSSRTNFGR